MLLSPVIKREDGKIISIGGYAGRGTWRLGTEGAWTLASRFVFVTFIILNGR